MGCAGISVETTYCYLCLRFDFNVSFVYTNILRYILDKLVTLYRFRLYKSMFFHHLDIYLKLKSVFMLEIRLKQNLVAVYYSIAIIERK